MGVRCVCKARRAVIDARSLLLPHAVRDIFLNYMGNPRARFFARPSSAFPQVSGDLGLALGDGPCYGYGTFVDHCSGLMLYAREIYRDYYCRRD
ncbi:hypothetical protein ACP70R_016446 [Stipagrostis hirtigluma subsp. patula]